MRDHVPAHEETRELHPVATDQPGLILHRPYQKLRQIAVVYALLPLLCAALGGFVVIKLVEANTDRRLAALERDLAERRATNQRGNAERDRQISELRRLVCIFADHSQPRDAQVEEIRAKYGCDGGPYSEPSVTPAPPRQPGPGGPSPGVPRTSAGDLPSQPALTATSTRTVPAPSSSPPADDGPLVCVDLPLLPPVCL